MRRLRSEPLEDRRLLSVTLYVNDNWAVTSPSAHIGLSPVAGDIVANTGTGDDGLVSGIVYGQYTSTAPSAWSTVQGALDAVHANDTVDILAGAYTFNSAYSISTQLTITDGHGPVTLSGANGVFDLKANVTIQGGGQMTSPRIGILNRVGKHRLWNHDFGNRLFGQRDGN